MCRWERRRRLVIRFFFWGVFVDGGCGLVAEMVILDFEEGDSEFLDAEGVDDGVYGRVVVREEDGNIDEDVGFVVGWVEEGDVVEDV